EILQRNGAALHALAQRQPRTQRDQRRRSVANGRTVGDVSADRPHIADLFTTNAGYQLPKRRDAPGQGSESLAVGNAGSDGNDAVVLRDRLEPVQPADEDDGRDLAHEFRHPQADVGGAGNHGGIRFGFEQKRKIIDIRRHDQPALSRANLDARAITQGGETLGHCGTFDKKRILSGLTVTRNGARSTYYRLVTGAAAQIALERRLDLRDRGVRRSHPKAVERHDEARRAKAALRAVEIDQRLL